MSRSPKDGQSSRTPRRVGRATIKVEKDILSEVRERFPEYKDLSDSDLVRIALRKIVEARRARSEEREVRYMTGMASTSRPVEKPKCPFCGFDGESKLLKTWKYAGWDVYLYQCSNCSKKFRWQVDPSGVKRSFIMRVGVGKRSR